MVTSSTHIPPAGVSVALLTPVTESGALDLEAVDRLVARAIDAGAAGVSPTGSTGEGSRLSRDQRRQVVARAAAAARGRPVMAGVPCRAVDDTVAELKDIADAGADAAMIAPPGYYPISDAETVRLFTELADRTPLPLILYHIPSLAKAGFSPVVAGQLARHPAVVGMKDSSRDLEHLRAVVLAAADEAFRVVTGTDALLPEGLAAGAVGAIVASPNAAPDLAVSLFRSWTSGDGPAAVRALQDRLATLVAACRRAGFPTGWKTAAALTGACQEHPVPPGTPLTAEARQELRRECAGLGLLSGETT